MLDAAPEQSEISLQLGAPPQRLEDSLGLGPSGKGTPCFLRTVSDSGLFLADGFARQPDRAVMTGILSERIRAPTDKSAPTPDVMQRYR